MKFFKSFKAEVEGVVIGEGRVKNGGLVEDVVSVPGEREEVNHIPTIIVDKT